MKNLLLLFVMVLSFALPTINAQSLAQLTAEETSLYNAICIFNDITPGDIGMNEFRVLAKEYAVEIGLVYTNYTFNGAQNIEILHADKTITQDEEISEKVSKSPVHNNTGNTTISNDSTEQFNYSITTDLPVLRDTFIVYRNIESERTITITTVDTLLVPVSVPNVPFCDCANKSPEELNMYYTETLAKRRACKDPELKDRYGFCAYQIRKYKKSLSRGYSRNDKEVLNSTVGSFSMILPALHIGDISKVCSAPPKTQKRRTRKLGKGHARTRGGFLSKIFPFINC